MQDASGPLPLLVFYTFPSRDTFIHELRLVRQPTVDSGPALVAYETQIDVYAAAAAAAAQQQPQKQLYISVCRCPGGVEGFMERVKKLCRHVERDVDDGNHQHPVLFSSISVFHPDLASLGSVLGYHERVFINYPVQHVLANALGFGQAVSDEQRNRLAESVTYAPWAQLVATLAGGHFNAVPMLRIDPSAEEEDDPDLQAALRQSLEEDEERRAQQQQKAIALPAGWDQVLLSAERAAAPDQKAGGGGGDPVCTVCLENRVGICLVPCGHQTVCDLCVRVIWTQSALNKVCPTCRAEVACVVRPVVSGAALAAPETTKKKRRKLK